MESYAILRNYPVPPRKVRRVANLIRGLPIGRALASLRFQPSPNAARLEKVLLSAVANWEAKHAEAKTTDLYVKEIRIDAGPIIKRFRPAPKGRATRIRKRSGHVFVKVAIPESQAVDSTKMSQTASQGEEMSKQEEPKQQQLNKETKGIKETKAPSAKKKGEAKAPTKAPKKEAKAA